MTRRAIAAVAALAAIAFAGCSGRTTPATNVTSTTATLNAVGSCDDACSAFMRWRLTGTSAWTNGAVFTVPNRVTDVPFGRPATGLEPGREYEFQACGKERSYPDFVCVGPDGKTGRTQRFTTPNERVFDRPGSFA